MSGHRNELAGETSPYLLQHAGNPVDWRPWGEEAFELARALDRPVLLSVGYSACHWCHVMERESFEDPSTAQLMNEHFVSIKVDREERPDLDGLYMTAVVAQTGQGGWPMTVFLTPDGRPFYGGTYFPPEARGGLPSFTQVLEGIATAYRERREVVEQQASEMAASLQAGRLGSPPEGFRLGEGTLLDALLTLRGQHDERNGGFGRAPKFPPHSVLTFLLRMHRRTGSEEALAMALRTLGKMADGGIHDQLGGGFHRYAVDAIWLVPHFEQMLYDNALLARAYLAAWQLTGDERWRTTAEGVLDYLLRELALEHGGFASAQDADTDGIEGATFTWTPAQLRELLSPGDAELAARVWGVTEEGNFEGATVLSLIASPENEAERAQLAEIRPDAARGARGTPAACARRQGARELERHGAGRAVRGCAPLPAPRPPGRGRALRRVPARAALAPGRRSLAHPPRRAQPGARLSGRLRTGRGRPPRALPRDPRASPPGGVTAVGAARMRALRCPRRLVLRHRARRGGARRPSARARRQSDALGLGDARRAAREARAHLRRAGAGAPGARRGRTGRAAARARSAGLRAPARRLRRAAVGAA